MTFKQALLLDGKVIRYKNWYGAKKIGKIHSTEKPTYIFPHGKPVLSRLRIVQIRGLLTHEHGVGSIWSTSSRIRSDRTVTDALKGITVIEVLPETKSMRFSE